MQLAYSTQLPSHTWQGGSSSYAGYQLSARGYETTPGFFLDNVALTGTPAVRETKKDDKF